MIDASTRNLSPTCRDSPNWPRLKRRHNEEIRKTGACSVCGEVRPRGGGDRE